MNHFLKTSVFFAFLLTACGTHNPNATETGKASRKLIQNFGNSEIASGIVPFAVGSGPGSTHVKIYDLRTINMAYSQPISGPENLLVTPPTPIKEFMAYGLSQSGVNTAILKLSLNPNRIYVATIPMDTGNNSAAHLKIWDTETLTTVCESFAFNLPFAGGASLVAGDFDGDGFTELAVGAGPGGGPHVIIYNIKPSPTNPQNCVFETKASFFAFPSSYSGGVKLAAGVLQADGGKDQLIISHGAGLRQVKAYNLTSANPYTMTAILDTGLTIQDFYGNPLGDSGYGLSVGYLVPERRNLYSLPVPEGQKVGEIMFGGTLKERFMYPDHSIGDIFYPQRFEASLAKLWQSPVINSATVLGMYILSPAYCGSQGCANHASQPLRDRKPNLTSSRYGKHLDGTDGVVKIYSYSSSDFQSFGNYSYAPISDRCARVQLETDTRNIENYNFVKWDAFPGSCLTQLSVSTSDRFVTVADPIKKFKLQTVGLPKILPLNSSEVESSMAVTGINSNITKINLILSIYDTDLAANNFEQVEGWLTGPDGTKIKIMSQSGLADIVHYSVPYRPQTVIVLDDRSAYAVNQQSHITYSSTIKEVPRFRPLPDKLSAFNGKNANGNWVITLKSKGKTSGTPLKLMSWGIEFLTEPQAPLNSPIPKITSIEINPEEHGVRHPYYNPLGGVQRSMIVKMRINFDSHVTLTDEIKNSIVLLNETTQSEAILYSYFYDEGTGTSMDLYFVGGSTDSLFSITQRFPSLSDGLYKLTVKGEKISSAAGSLDGDGNGTEGGDHTYRFHRLFGDTKGRRIVDVLDFVAFRNAFANPSSYWNSYGIFDFDQNGAVNSSDFGAFRLRYNKSL